MPLIIDTYNVLHTVGVLPPHLAGIDVSGLMELIQVSRYRKRQVDLVCDGRRPSDAPGRSGTMVVRFSGTRLTADDVIRELVLRSTAPKRLLVVTSDQAIVKDVRKRRCRVLSSDVFLEQLIEDVEMLGDRPAQEAAAPEKHDGDQSSRAVRAWLKAFDIDDSMLAIPASEPRAEVQPLDPDDEDDDAADVRGHVPEDRKQAGTTTQESGLPADMLAEAAELARQITHAKPAEPQKNQRRKSDDAVAPPANPSRDDGDGLDMDALFPGVKPLDD